MADLDDFFSKRDKKKKSKEQKFETTGLDDVAKILDAKVKERKKQETNKSTYQVSASDGTEQLLPSDYRAQEDDEWKELVEEKPDYTGLKIQELVLEDEDEIAGKDASQEDGDKPREGPWKKVEEKRETEEKRAVEPEASIAVEAPTIAQPPISSTTDSAPAPASKLKSGTGGAYIPPSKRDAISSSTSSTAAPTIARPPISSTTDSAPAPKLQSGTGGAYIPPSKRGGVPSSTSSSTGYKPKKHVAAPNINDEQYFPSLGETRQS